MGHTPHQFNRITLASSGTQNTSTRTRFDNEAESFRVCANSDVVRYDQICRLIDVKVVEIKGPERRLDYYLVPFNVFVLANRTSTSITYR